MELKCQLKLLSEVHLIQKKSRIYVRSQQMSQKLIEATLCESKSSTLNGGPEKRMIASASAPLLMQNDFQKINSE